MKLLALIKKTVRRIPGFRQMSSSSMIIAVTYYGAAALTMVKYWYWGVALLALPFFIFYLLDANIMGSRKLCLAVSITAGLLVLLGTAGGLSAAGAYHQPAGNRVIVVPSPSPSALKSPGATATAAPADKASPSGAADTAAVAAAVTASAETAPAQAAFVAARGGKVFHLPGCASARQIKPENVTGFITREDAEAAGLMPCKRCKP